MISLAHLRQAAIDRLKELAGAITPAPASLIVFGSFARSQAGPDSDVDVLAFRPVGLASDADDWRGSLGQWVGLANRTIGNPVNLIEIAADEVSALLDTDHSVWRDAATEGIVLVGLPLADLATAI